MTYWAKLLVLLSLLGVPVGAWDIDLGTCESVIEFRARGKWDAFQLLGKVSSERKIFPIAGVLSVDKNKLSADAIVNLEGCETGISLRDRLLKERYLETHRWPKAHFKLHSMLLPSAFETTTEVADLPFDGTLDLHGVERPVQGTADLEKVRKLMKVRFSFPIRLNEHEIKRPEFKGLHFSETVDVVVMVNAPLNHEK